MEITKTCTFKNLWVYCVITCCVAILASDWLILAFKHYVQVNFYCQQLCVESRVNNREGLRESVSRLVLFVEWPDVLITTRMTKPTEVQYG